MGTHDYRWDQNLFCLKESCVIEFQAFRGNDNKYIVKELVILDVKSGVTNYFLFKPPFPFHNLNKTSARTNSWLSKYFHHIPWQEGFTEYKELQNIFTQYCNNYKNIFTAGLEKCELLSSYSSSKVNIFNITRQKNEIIPGICIGVKCQKHKYHNCAMSNAYNLKTTLHTIPHHILLSSGDKRVGVMGHK